MVIYGVHESGDLFTDKVVSGISDIDGIENLRLTYAVACTGLTALIRKKSIRR